mgnify:CR=1 FL=1
MKTVILLIDFKGHPALGDEYLNNLRYKEVQKILSNPLIDKTKIVPEFIAWYFNKRAIYRMV